MRAMPALVLALALMAPVHTIAQPAQVPIRILDEDRLFRESRLGQSILEGLRAAEEALERENAEIFERLAAEESALTALRPSLSPEAFRSRADEFDRHVEEIRAERAERARQLARQSEAETQAFFQDALPVLVDLLGELGVVALFKPDVLILGTDWLDITDVAIRRLDAETARPGGN